MDDQQSNPITVELTDEQQAYVKGLRTLADLLEQHPELFWYQALDHMVGVGSAAEMAAIARSAGGKWDKREIGNAYFQLEQQLGGGVKVTIFTEHSNVCERVVTGTRTVQVPDPDVMVPLVEIEEEIVKWICPPSILAVSA